MTSGGTLAAGLARAAPSFAPAAPPSTSGVLSLVVTFPLLTGNWRRASSSASRIWRAFTLQAMATTTAATAAAPSPNQAATAGWLAPWARDSNMSSIKTYDRTIREPVRYIRTERAPAPPTATRSSTRRATSRCGPRTRASRRAPSSSCRRTAADGSDWLTDPQTQIRWGEDYIPEPVRHPGQAWAYWQARRYYGPLLAVV